MNTVMVTWTTTLQNRPAPAELGGVALLLAYFVARTVYLAVHFPAWLPPDELVHAGLCELYASTAGLPTDSPATHHLGVVAHQPFLYYWLMGRVLALNVTPLSNLLFLRVANAAMSWVLVLVAWRWIRLVSSDLIVRVFFILILTNTLMLTGLSASVSPDNLVNVLAAAGIYGLTCFVRAPGPWTLLGLTVVLLAGTLTKITFLPFAAIVTLCVVVGGRHRPDALTRLGAALTGGRAGVVMAMTILGLGVANLAVYGGNLLRFGHLVPRTSQILSQEERLANPTLARTDIADRYRRGLIGRDEAERLAREIPSEALRRDTLSLVSLTAGRLSGETPFEPYSRLGYVWPWLHLMSQRIVGFMGHETFFHRTRILAVYWGMALVAATVFLLGLTRGRRVTELEWMLVAIAVFYTLVLMQLQNYPTYRDWGVLALAVQGRYLFPVLLPLYGLAARFGLEWLPPRLRWPAAVGAGAWFVAFEFPYFLLRASPVFLAVEATS